MKNYPISRAVTMLGIGIILGIFFYAGCQQPMTMGQPHREYLDNFVLVRVYDGDTFYVTFPTWDPIVGEELGIRINGIDTPEMRTKSMREKYLAKQAKAYVEKRLTSGKYIELHNVKRGKYFRLVADVIVDGNDLAKDLIDFNLAVPYDGGTKTVDWSKR